MSARKSKRVKKKNQLTIELPANKQYQAQLVEVVNDGAIAGTGIALDKLIPVVIVDARNRPDLRDIAQAHDSDQPGDVTVQWSRLRGGEFDNRLVISLLLHFVRPIDSYAFLIFDVRERGMLVDQILRTKYLYFQAGSPGDRLGHTLDSGRVLVEVRDTGFEVTWEGMLYDFLVSGFESRGLDKKASSSAAKQTISTLRKFGSIRLPDQRMPREEGDTKG